MAEERSVVETNSDNVTIKPEGNGAFRELTDALKKPLGDGGGAGGGGDNDGDGSGGGDDGPDGDGYRRLVRILQEGLAQVGERQSDFTVKTVESAFDRVMDGLNIQVKDLADVIMQAVTKSISKNADLGEHVANFMERVVKLEADVAWLKAQRDGPSDDERGRPQ